MLLSKNKGQAMRVPVAYSRDYPAHADVLIPHDLSNWILDRQSDLQEAMSAGDIKQVLELTSLQSQGAEKLAELTGGMAT